MGRGSEWPVSTIRAVFCGSEAWIRPRRSLNRSSASDSSGVSDMSVSSILPPPEFPAVSCVGVDQLTMLDTAQLGHSRKDIVVLSYALLHSLDDFIVGRTCHRSGRL